MSGFKPLQAAPKRVQKRAKVAKAALKTRKAKMSTATKSKEVQAASEAVVAHQWGESKLADAELQANLKIIQDDAQAGANQGTKSALTNTFLAAKFSKNPKAIADAEAKLKAAGFTADDVDSWAAGKAPHKADAQFDEPETGIKFAKGVDAASVPVYPALEPFADLETIRKTVEKYESSFQLSSDASPFGGLGQIIKKYGKIPFAVLAVAALTSKGIHMIDAGTLIAFNTTVVMFSYFALGQEGIRNSYRELIDGMNERYQDGLKTSVALYEAGIKHCRASIDKPSIISEANDALQEAHEALTEARVRVAQQQHKDQTVSKLNLIIGQEQAEAKAAAEKARSSALSYLKTNALTAKVKDEVFNEALSLVGKSTGTGAPEFKALQNVLKDALSKAK